MTERWVVCLDRTAVLAGRGAAGARGPAGSAEGVVRRAPVRSSSALLPWWCAWVGHCPPGTGHLGSRLQAVSVTNSALPADAPGVRRDALMWSQFLLFTSFTFPIFLPDSTASLLLADGANLLYPLARVQVRAQRPDAGQRVLLGPPGPEQRLRRCAPLPPGDCPSRLSLPRRRRAVDADIDSHIRHTSTN